MNLDATRIMCRAIDESRQDAITPHLIPGAPRQQGNRPVLSLLPVM
jgi:hypothetical protein